MTTPTATQALDSATEPFRRSDLAIVRFAEFQRLWSAYRQALSVPRTAEKYLARNSEHPSLEAL